MLQTSILTKQNFLQADLYLDVGAEVILTSNLWSDVRLKSGDKVTVVDFFYNNAEGPRSGKLIETAVVQFCDLDSEVITFLPRVTRTVSIPVHCV